MRRGKAMAQLLDDWTSEIPGRGGVRMMEKGKQNPGKITVTLSLEVQCPFCPLPDTCRHALETPNLLPAFAGHWTVCETVLSLAPQGHPLALLCPVHTTPFVTHPTVEEPSSFILICGRTSAHLLVPESGRGGLIHRQLILSLAF